MNRIIRVEALCCKRCADRVAGKVELLDGVQSAKGNSRKNVILVSGDCSVTDERLRSVVEGEGFKVLSIEPRKGLFY